MVSGLISSSKGPGLSDNSKVANKLQIKTIKLHLSSRVTTQSTYHSSTTALYGKPG